MYYSISGKVVYFEDNQIVLDNLGVGYDICVSTQTIEKLAKIGNTITLYTTLRISDDTIKLFGFYAKEEKAMFLKLVSVSGIGPKTAIQILSSIDPKTLALNIVSSDYKTLAKVKGIGKKTAMRIVVELKEKLEEEDLEVMMDTKVSSQMDTIAQDAILALTSLGMNRADAARKVSEVRSKVNSVEEILALALRGL